ncbi:SDR family oxidoreductase [Mycolicibacterium sp. 22603]|uniref:SDR family oxidoreductase n=1 Tax=Mycolicibacterium sp. 22603 TaxID=3453950 RepID=UPI003F85F20A
MRVLITGASGGIGSAIIDQLRGNDEVEVWATCRHPRSAQIPGIHTVFSDLDRPASMRPALEGVDCVFLFSFTRQEVLPELVDALSVAGVTKVVVLSTIDTTRHEPFVEYNKQRHLAVENAIIDGGFTTVSLRPGAFARNAIRFWASQIRRDRTVGLPFPDSQQAPIADEDIAAVAVRAITTPHLDGAKIVLTGPDSLTMRDQIGLIGEALGESIGITVLCEREARALYGEVLPPEYLDLLMGQWAFETTERAVVTDAVREITGRGAVTYREWAIAHREAFV